MTGQRGPGFLRAVLIVVTCVATIVAGCTTSPKSGRPVADTDAAGTTDRTAGDDDDGDEGDDGDERPADSQVGDTEPVARRTASAEPGGDECAELQVIPCVLQVAEVAVPILGLDRFLHYRSDRVPGRTVAPQADILGVGIGGFTLGEHHVYVPDAEVLLSGDGTRRSVAALDHDGMLLIASRDGSELYEFDPAGVHLRTRNATTGDEIRTFEYGDDGRLTAIRTPGEPELTVDRRGDAVTLGVDGTAIMHLTLADGMLTEVTSPLDGKVYRFGYAEGGLLTSMTGPLGIRTTYRYDEDGRLTAGETDDGGITVTRDGQDVTVSVDDRRQGSLSIPEDPTQPWVWAGESGEVVRETVDESGDRSIDFGDGVTVEITAADHPLFGAQARYAATTVISRPGESTVTEHRTITAEGPLNAPTEVRRTVDSGAGATVTVWDAATRIVSSTTPGGRTTRVRLDELGRIQGTGGFGMSEMSIERGTDNYPTAVTVDGIDGDLTWADGGVTTSLGGAEQTMHIGRDGSVSSVTDALGRTMSRETVGTTVTTGLNGDTLSVGAGDDHHMTWSFPAGGGAFDSHTTTIDEDAGTITSGWDGGRIVTTTLADGLPVRTESGDTVTTFDYDDGGALRSITRGGIAVGVSESGRGGTWSGLVETPLDIAYETDDAGLASGVTIGDTTFEVRYDPDGLLTRMGPISFERSTEKALVTEQTVGNVVLRRDYDDAARLSGTTVAVGDETIADVSLRRDDTRRLLGVDMTVPDHGESTSYDYDAAGRLVSAERGDHRWTYTWDERDNLIEIVTDGQTRTIAVDGANRITRADGKTYSYNKDHALAARSDGLAIATTPTGSVERVTLPDGTVVEYVLDGMNRRVGRLLDGEVTDYFTYHDALRPAAQYTADGELAAAFFYDDNGALAAITKPDGTYAVVTDSVGSPVLVIDAETGTVQQQITYDPFGTIIDDTNPGFQPFGFVGALADPDTGLVNIGAREYDPALGRFLSADPALADGSPINLYAYGQGNPVEVVDRNGRKAAIYAGPPGPTRAQMDEFNAMLEDFLDSVAALGEAGLSGASAAAGGFSGWADITDLARRLDLDAFRAGAMASWGKYSPAELVSELQRIRMLRNAALAADLFPVLDVLTGAYGVYSAHQEILLFGPSNLRAANLAAALLGLISGILGVLALVGVGLLASELLLLLGMASALLSFCLMIELCASIFGDPHIRTADGAHFNFQGAGEFWAVRSDGGGFDVQVRQEPIGSTVSAVTAAAVRIGETVVALYADEGRLTVDGKGVEIPVGAQHVADGAVVTRVDPRTYRVLNPAGDTGVEVHTGGSLDVAIGFGDALVGRVSGLYGAVDGDPENDWMLPDGTVIDMVGDGAFERLHRTVGPAWRVAKADLLLDGPSVWDADFPPRAISLDDLSAADRARAQALCRAAGLTTEPYLGDCVLDVAVTGDIAFAASAARSAGIVQQTPTRADQPLAEAASAHTTVIYDAHMTDFPVQDDGAGHALVIVDGEDGHEVVAVETDPGAAGDGPDAGAPIAWRHPTDSTCGVAVGGSGGSTWVAIPSTTGVGDGDGTRVIHLVDADSGTVSRTITLAHERGSVCGSIAATDDAVVVRTNADGVQLTGYDADTAESLFVIEGSDDSYGPVTAGDGSIWVAADDGDEITAGRVDLSEGELQQVVTLPGDAFESALVATADGFVASISGADGQAIVRVGADGVRWTRAFPVTVDDKDYGVPSRLAVDGDVVAGYSTSSFLVVLDARTGDRVGVLSPTSFNNNGGHVTMHDGDVTVGTFGGKHWVEGHDPLDGSLAFGFAAPEGPTLSDVKHLDSLGVHGLVVQSAVEGLDAGRDGMAVTIFR